MANPIKVIKLTGVSGSLEGKADINHDHVLADITDAGTAAASDTSDFASATQGTKADNAIQAGTLASVNADISDATLIDTTDPRLSNSRTPTAHSHTLSEITDSGTAASRDVATVGNASAAEVVTGDDSRLSDDRDPTAHTHTLSDISDSNNLVKTTDVDVSGSAWVVNEADLVSNSATKVPTQASVKSYVDTEITQISTTTPFKGAYNASTNTPDLTSPSAVDIVAGDAYIVDTEGSFYATTLTVGTTIIADVDSPTSESNWTVVVSGGLDAATIKTSYESNADTNAFTDAEQTKLAGIDANATADQTGAEIKLAYESQPNTNAYTDTESSAVADIVAGEYTRNDQNTVAGNNWVIDDDTMATASPQTLASSESIKNYVDSLTGGSGPDLTDHMVFRGDYDAATNTPDLDGSAPRQPVTSGDTYVVSADGQFWTEDVTVGTLIIANEDDPTGVSGWEIISGTSDLSSLSDVTSAAVTDKFALIADGAAYVGRALVEADISDLGTYSTASSTETLTNKTFDANGTGNSITNIDLTADVIGDLPYSNLVPSTAASRLVGRGDSGSGDMEEITLGTGLNMSGTTLSASGGSAPDDTAYGISWDANTDAATKNAIYDKIQTLVSKTEIDAKGDLLVGTADNLLTRLPTAVNGKVLTTSSGTATGLVWADAAGGADDTAYGISWDGDTTTAPSKNAVYDKIETLGGGADDTAYGISWDGDTTTAPSKNAVYDKIETLSGADDTAYGISWDGDTTTAPSKNAVYDKIETLSGATYGMLYNNGNAATSVCNANPAKVGWASSGLSSGTTPSTAGNAISLPTAGTYRVEANLSCTTDTAGEYQFELYQYSPTTGWTGTGFVADRAMPNNGDVGSVTVSGIVQIAATSPISAVAVYQSCDTSTSNFLVQSGQLVVTKL